MLTPAATAVHAGAMTTEPFVLSERDSPSRTRPALLALARAQAARRRPIELLQQWQRDGTVGPSDLDLRDAVRLDGIALSTAEEYDAVLLSPVAPLGMCSVLAPTSQDRTLTTTRATEVVSDPTNALALEAADRLAADSSASVRLCTAHQVLRMQRPSSEPGRSQHFRLFCLAEAAFGRADHAVELEAISRQLTAILATIGSAASQFDRDYGRISALLETSPGRDGLADRVTDLLSVPALGLDVERGVLQSDYYDGVRIQLFVDGADGPDGPDGDRSAIADLGLFDWVGQLLGDRRARFIASGVGLQLLPVLGGPGR
jgi:hypothetical protein